MKVTISPQMGNRTHMPRLASQGTSVLRPQTSAHDTVSFYRNMPVLLQFVGRGPLCTFRIFLSAYLAHGLISLLGGTRDYAILGSQSPMCLVFLGSR